MSGTRKSILWGKITILFVICCCCLPAQAKYDGGTGEPNDPYKIADANDLLELGTTTDDYDKHFILIADVNMVSYTFTTAVIGADTDNTNDDFDGIPFTGVFDGAGHRILNLTIDSVGDNYFLGLIGFVHGEKAQVKNLGLGSVSITITGGNSSRCLGGLCGRNDGTISNCYSTGSVTGVYGVGGLVGYNRGTISNCYSKASVSGDRLIGGLVGSNNGTITNCYSQADVSGVEDVGGLVGGNGGTITNCCSSGIVSGIGYVGGLVGWNNGTITVCHSTGSVMGTGVVGGLCGRNRGGTITNCYSTAGVSGTESSVGGLVGDNYSTITNSYSTGSVTGDKNVGGLVAWNCGTITNCYAAGSVLGGDFVGGLVGENDKWIEYGIIMNCYSTASVMGNGDVGGLVGLNNGSVTASFWDIETSGQTTSSGGTGLATEQMQIMSTFTDAGWDFVGETVNGIEDIWFIPEGDYPHLWWEGMQVPMKLTPRTLNCRSEGNWVKAHLTLPEGFTVADVNSNRPAVLHSFGFQSPPLYVFVNKDKLVEIEASFERQAVCSLAGDWPQELTVAGFLADGNIFLGTSNVRIIHPDMKVIEELASCWLNADCVQSDFCDGIDMNRDSLVNLLDYALLMNIEVEFVTDE